MHYTAFLSYSHEDDGFARRFHRQLEGWKVPSDLVGRQTETGVIANTLRPIFRDREDFAGGHSLKEATLHALEASRFLIVLCSPAAARSEYVTEEARLFKAMGRAERVIPVIIAGEPGNPERECFPDSVRFQVGADGSITEEAAAPIAADARDIGDGRNRALAKVVAGILGVPFDEIIRRAERARRNRNAFGAGAAVGAFVFATAFASFALYQNYQSGVTIEKSVFAIGGLIQETDGLSDRGLDQKRAQMLRTQCDLMEGLAHKPEQIGLIEKTICLTQQARAIYEVGEKGKAINGLSDWLALRRREFDAADSPTFEQALSLVDSARAVAELRMTMAEGNGEAVDILKELVAIADMAGRKRPGIRYIRAIHDEAVWPLIEALEKVEDYQASIDLMEQAADLRKRQADVEQDDIARLDQGIFLRRIAALLGDHNGDHARALEIARQAVAVFESLSDQLKSRQTKPTATLHHEKSLAHQVLADELIESGDLENARTAYRTALDNLTRVRDSADHSEESAEDVAYRMAYLTERLALLEP
uniref:TIR domain-containing protein n=1 Tax=Candidatus Kentrum sp. FW TaxID=2126338 RepID=A0A450T244_9GAMM|nr:MAG: TIR domain-containing protein [Candidatus Kentron sp. FW]